MWEFAKLHEFIFFFLTMGAMTTVTTVFKSVCQVVVALGTHHCSSCACHEESGGTVSDE